MADTDPNANPSGSASAATTSTVTTLEQLAAIVAGLSGTLATFTSQAQAQFTSLSEQVKKVSESVTGATDSDSGYLVRASVDPAANQRRLETYAEMAVADAIEFRKGCDALILRKISQDSDHHAGLPPMAPRSASGPGTTAS